MRRKILLEKVIHMEILVTGNIKEISKDFFEMLRKQGKVIICGKTTEKIKGRKLETFDYDIRQEEFETLFRTYDFDRVIYFSANTGETVYQEIEQLDRVLSFSRRRDKTRVIYVAPDDLVLQEGIQTSQVVDEACRTLCKKHALQGGSILHLRVPFLVFSKYAIHWVHRCMKKLSEGTRIELPYDRNQQMDFLFLEDLASFLINFMDGNEGGFLQYELSGENKISMEQLVKIWDGYYPEGSISFGKNKMTETCTTARIQEKYGWTPRMKITGYFESWCEEAKHRDLEKQTLGRKWLQRRKTKGFVTKLIYLVEFFVLLAVCEFLTWKTREMPLMDFADFRLFFVAIAATLYGLRMGGLAAVMASLMYTISRQDSINWQIQFYNIINWLPYATYLLVGTMLGYTKDRYADRVNSAVNSQRIMEEKYVYLNNLYNKVLENKESYGAQIVNYRNSFGRIYDATRQLNSVSTGEIFYHAIAVLEDMLETTSVAIYSLDGGSFARLSACSRGLRDTLTKSLKMEDMPDCRKTLESAETWINKARLAGQPDYAYGVYKDGVLFAMIVMWDVEYNQLSIEYTNRFNIVSGLISDALIRATDYQMLSEQEVMIKDTKIMKYEAFCKEVEIQKQLQESHQAQYVLLKVISEERDYGKLSSILQQVTRKNDILGIGQDKNVYVLLSQADRSNMSAIQQRMEKGGVKVETVEYGEALI